MLRSRLVYECPEIHDWPSGPRAWSSEIPPRLWRIIAGHPVDKRGRSLPTVTVGPGISGFTKHLAEQICTYEKLFGIIETECEEILETPDFEIYRKVLDEEWPIGKLTQVAILAAIYPIEPYLSEDGNPIRKRVHASGKSLNAKTVRHRSLKQFKRAIGAGRQWIQSGKKEYWAKTGDPTIRASIYAYLDVVIVVRRQPSIGRLKKTFPEIEEILSGLSKSKRSKLIAQRYSLRAQVDSWYRNCSDRSFEMWKHPVLIKKAAEFTGVSENIAQLQLFYEFAPQCQNRSKSKRLMKVCPRFVERLFKGLTKEYKDKLQTGASSSYRTLLC